MNFFPSLRSVTVPPSMNRNILVSFLAVLAAVGLFFGYQAYKLSADRELAQQRAAAELALARQHQEESARRAAAMVEARRMAEARAKEEMAAWTGSARNRPPPRRR